MATTISSGRANSPKLTANIADHGTIYGGRGLIFDGVTDYLDCGTGLGSSLGDNYAGSLTISLWFKNGGANDDGLLDIGSGSGSGKLWISLGASGKLWFNLNNGNWSRSVAFTDTSSWHHLVCVYSAGSESSSLLYLDGESVGATTGTFPSASDMDFGTNNKLAIGNFWDRSAYHFLGNISDVKIWNSALSESDVTSQYLKPESTPSQDNIIAWYPMCEGNPDSPQSIVYDHSEKKSGTQKFYNPTFDGNITYWLTTGTSSSQSYNSSTGHMRQVVTANDGWWSLHWNQPHTFSDFGLFEAKVHFVSGNPFQVKFQLRDAGGTYHNKYSPELSSVGDSYHFKYYINGIGSYSDQRFYLTNSENGDTADWEFVKFTPINMGNHATTSFSEQMITSTANNREFTNGTTTNWVEFYGSGGTVAVNDTDNTLTYTVGGSSTTGGVKLNVATYGRNAVEVGKKYKLSVKAKCDDSSNTFRISYGGVEQDQTLTTSFATYTFTETATSATNEIFLFMTSVDSGALITMDDISFEEVGISSAGFATAQEEPTIPQVPLLRYNEKMVFDGVDDECSMGLGASAFGEGNQTLSAWFNASDLTGNQVIFGAGHYSAITTYGGPALMLSNAVLHGVAGEGASTVYDNLTSGTLSVGKTYHAVFVRDATNNYYYLYVNGALADSYSSSIDPRYNDTYDFWMMGRSGNASEKGNYFQGTIDECSVFNTALSNTEVQELFNDGVALDANSHSKADNLMGYWRNDGISSWIDRSDIQAMSFDASSDYITIANESNFDYDIDQAFSSSFWVINNGTSGDRVVMAKGTSTTTSSWYIRQDGTGARFNFSKSDAQLGNVTASGVFSSTGSWQHIAITYNGGSNLNGAKIYVNGSLSATGSDTAFSGSMLNNGALTIGGMTGGGASWDGKISQIAIWNKELSASEVSAIYALGRKDVDLTTSYSTNLQGYWFLSAGHSIPDATGSNGVLDRSANSNHGTITNATLDTGNNGTPAGTPESIIVREGLNSNKDGLGFPFKNDDKNVLRMDNVNEKITIDDSDAFSFGNAVGDLPFSVMAWIKPEDATNFFICIKGVYADNTNEWSVFCTNTDKFGIQLFDESASAFPYRRMDASMTENAWSHVAVTYDGSGGATAMNGVKIYHNGAVTSSDSVSNDGSYVAMENLADKLYIGTDKSNSTKGLIDELMIYNKELSATEITKNYKHGKGKHKN